MNKSPIRTFVSFVFVFLSIGFFTQAGAYNNFGFTEITPKNLSDVMLTDLNNKSLLLEKLEGNILVLHFWATWCSTCHESLKKLDKLQKKLRKQPIIILPVSEDFKGANLVKEFYDKNVINNLPIFIDLKNKIFKEIDIVNLPTTIIINTAGEEVARATSDVDWTDEKIEDYLLKFVAQKPQANADYLNLMNSQFNDRLNYIEPTDSKTMQPALPPEAETTVEPVELKKETVAEKTTNEVKVTNMELDEFSLKIRRPVNAEASNLGDKDPKSNIRKPTENK